MTATQPRRAVRFHTSGIYAVLELDDGTEIDLEGCRLASDDLLAWLSSQMMPDERLDAARMLDPNIPKPGMCDCDCDACAHCRLT